MDRSELAILSSGKQRAAFRTFTPQKRKQLWLSKFKQIKSLNFSKEELNHLKIMEEFLKKYDFSKELTKKQEEFFNSWFEEGKLNFKWTPYFLISGFAKLNENAVLSKKEFKSKFPEISMRDDLTTPPDEGGGGGSTDDCDCRWDWTCDLAQLGNCDDDDPCDDTIWGCGMFWALSCTGDCTG